MVSELQRASCIRYLAIPRTVWTPSCLLGKFVDEVKDYDGSVYFKIEGDDSLKRLKIGALNFTF